METLCVKLPCSSNTSSTSPAAAASDQKKGDNGESIMAKLKEKIVVVKESDKTKSGLHLSLISEKVGAGVESSQPRPALTCNFCKKAFPTPQALGGHQNAHRTERQIDKRRKEMIKGFKALGHQRQYPTNYYYSSYPSLSHQSSLYGSFNRALGVKRESMILKPAVSASYGFGHGGNLIMESFQAQKRSSTSFPTSVVAATSTSNIDSLKKRDASESHDHHLYDDNSGLDLSLRL